MIIPAPLITRYTLTITLLSLLTLNANAQEFTRQFLPYLEQEYAEFRADQVNNVAYSLFVEIDEDADDFSGTVDISFDLAQGNTAPLTFDFDQGNVGSITVNGSSVEWSYERWFITVAADKFQEGQNTVSITFTHPFTTDGDGLHKFTDPENGEVYLYTNFEPYKANRFFPLFDQPNLKAPFTIEVLVPEHWEVVSNQRETISSLEGDLRRWQFPATPPISTYLYSFHAGDFTVWEDDADGIALRLMVRKTLAEYVDTEEWFLPTRQFMAFFQEYFDVPYPLDKYDQVIVPDFNPGAMENLGAVTFNEAYVSRGEKSDRQRLRLAEVIAHEMAHMWFGDLVTMQWWNDLWLNESFATYMGILALDQASNFNNAWDVFYSRDKSRAYVADGRVTTHPIAPDNVDSTDDAFEVFDLITYEKGSSVLKQLPFFIGEDNFRRGVSNYLKENAYGNATVDNFVDALADSAGRDLSKWQKEWLQESGANTLRTDISCENNTISSLRLLQYVPTNRAADKTLRNQRTLVGFYRYTDNTMLRSSSIPVTYSGPVTWISEAVGLPCPDLVLSNEDDMAYFEMELDPRSLGTLREHINDFPSPTTRLMLWNSLWASVMRSSMSLDDFVDFAISNITKEQNDDVIRQVSGNLASAFNYYSTFGGQNEKRRAIENFIRGQLLDAAPGSEIQKIWFANYTNRAHTPEALDSLFALLDGRNSIEGLEIDQDKRWDIVFTLNRYLHANYEALLESESRLDSSDQGINSAYATRAVRPSLEAKQEFLSMVVDNPDDLKVATLRTILFNLFPPEQTGLLENLADDILQHYGVLNETGLERFLNSYIEILPTTCTQASIDRLAALEDEFAGYRPVLANRFLELQQADERCVSIRHRLD